jgi:N-methylhydantoinase A
VIEIAIDTGGTFTDGIAVEDRRKVSSAKFPTNVTDPASGIMGCIGLLAEERQLTQQELLADTATVVVGTTLATNCIVQNSGLAKCGLLYTKGFRDIPELGRRLPKSDIYNARLPPPGVLIPRHLRFGIEERVQFDGTVITALNEDDVREAARQAKAHGIEVPVICFLNSYVNPAHEERTADIIRDEFPDVVVSSRVLRRWIEWDRLTTAALAGSVKPVLRRFVTNLVERLKEAKFKGTLLFVTCSGGVATPEVCLDNPALLIGSGPAAGPLLGAFLAELNDFENAVICDMGGTSFDISILPQRTILTTTETAIGDYRSGCEAVDLDTLGAGGGSIAAVDRRGILQVGPASAGAVPGPACYNKGGSLPTVTDANVVLGYVPTDYFLGGKMPLDKARAEKAIRDHVAKPLGIDVIEAACAISSLVESNMAEMVLLSAVRKGYDPRDFRFVAGGGAGPIHAAPIAFKLGMQQVYIPKLASLFCTLGISLADYKCMLSRMLYRREDEVRIDDLNTFYQVLEDEGRLTLQRQGVPDERMQFIRGAEMRYSGQLHDIEILLPAAPAGTPFTKADLDALLQAFHDRHKAVYGYSDKNMPAIFSTLKLQAKGIRPSIELVAEPFSSADPSAALKRKREVYSKERGRFIEMLCYNAAQLKHGNIVLGPAILEHPQTTILVPDGAELAVDAYGNYSIVRAG